MTKQEFLEKHNFQEQDFKNLLRFEEARKSGAYNMYEYLALMTKLNINGGGKLASWVIGNYGEFLEVIGGENNEKN